MEHENTTTVLTVKVTGTDPDDAKNYVAAALSEVEAEASHVGLEIEVVANFPNLPRDAATLSGALAAIVNQYRAVDRKQLPDHEEKEAWIKGIELALSQGLIHHGYAPRSEVPA